MMAQESNDHLCLQHALTWLFRVQPENQHLLMQRCISKCNALGLSYLTSLGMIFFINEKSLVHRNEYAPTEIISPHCESYGTINVHTTIPLLQKALLLSPLTHMS